MFQSCIRIQIRTTIREYFSQTMTIYLADPDRFSNTKILILFPHVSGSHAYLLESILCLPSGLFSTHTDLLDCIWWCDWWVCCTTISKSRYLSLWMTLAEAYLEDDSTLKPNKRIVFDILWHFHSWVDRSVIKEILDFYSDSEQDTSDAIKF